MDRHPDQHYDVHFVTHHGGTWQDLVVEVMELAQQVGGNPWWMMLEATCLDLWTGKTNLPGCAAMHVVLARPRAHGEVRGGAEAGPFAPPGTAPGEEAL